MEKMFQEKSFIHPDIVKLLEDEDKEKSQAANR